MMTRAEASIEAGVLATVIEDMTSLIEDIGSTDNFILMVNSSSPYKGLKPPRIKPIGNVSLQRITDVLCDCGCRLLTDGSVYWCSGVQCNFIGKEESF